MEDLTDIEMILEIKQLILEYHKESGDQFDKLEGLIGMLTGRYLGLLALVNRMNERLNAMEEREFWKRLEQGGEE